MRAERKRCAAADEGQANRGGGEKVERRARKDRCRRCAFAPPLRLRARGRRARTPPSPPAPLPSARLHSATRLPRTAAAVCALLLQPEDASAACNRRWALKQQSEPLYAQRGALVLAVSASGVRLCPSRRGHAAPPVARFAQAQERSRANIISASAAQVQRGRSRSKRGRSTADAHVEPAAPYTLDAAVAARHSA